MNKHSISKGYKSRAVALAKHIGTQTSESNPSLTCKEKVNTIKEAFYRQSKMKCGHKKKSAFNRLMQTLSNKPKFQSTPLRNSEERNSSDSECEILVENITPIKVSCKSFRSLNEGYDSQNQFLNRMCWSDGNVPSNICSSPNTKQMLSLDETFLKSVDLESFETKLTHGYSTKITNNQSEGAVVTHGTSKQCNGMTDISLNRRENESENNKEETCMPPPLPPPPPTTTTITTSKYDKETKGSEVSVNSIEAIADIHCEDLINIDIDKWIDDSFMCSAMNSSSLKVNNNHLTPKRPIEHGNKNTVLTKKFKTYNTVSTENCDSQNNHEINVQQTLSPSRDALSVLSQNVSKSGEETSHKQTNFSGKKLKEVEQTLAEKENSVDGSNSTLSVSERIRRCLVTNAQRPVTSRRKSEVIQSSRETGYVKSLGEQGPFFGLPSSVKGLFARLRGINNLYEWQEECLNLKAVQEKKNLVYALPTSGGKTLVAEILMLRELLCYKKDVLFILPYVSIVQEKVHSLSPFALELEFIVEEYAAGKGQYPPIKRRKQSVYVATIEKAHSLINSLIEGNNLSKIGLVIVDELHLLGQGDRGATLECLLTRLLYSGEKIHIVGMSATIGNLEEVAKFLQAEIYFKNFRPVELKEYIKCEDAVLAVNDNEEDLFTKVNKVKPPYSASMKKVDPDGVCSLVMEVIPEYSCLVFCPSKSNCENVASMFSKIMPKDLLIKNDERNALLKALSSDRRGSGCPVLKASIPYGVAYHHSGLTTDERRLLEDAYRAGTLCCICCTSTLATGVNLPAKRVILRSPYVGRNFISLSQYKQMAGRAGRAGFDVSGESILMCQERDMNQVKNLFSSKMDEAHSQLHLSESRGLQSLVLSSFGLGLATCRKDLHKMVSCTLLYVQCSKLDVNPKQLVDIAVSRLFKLGALKVDSASSVSKVDSKTNTTSSGEDSNLSLNITNHGEIPASGSGIKRKVKHFDIGHYTSLKISRIGRAAMKGSIPMGHAHKLYNDLVCAQTSLVLLTHLHLLYLITPYDMLDQIKMDSDIYFHVYSKLGVRDLQTATVLGITQGCMLKIMKGSKSCSIPERVLHRFYVTLILNDLWNQCDVWDVAERYKVPRGTVQNLMTSAATFASCVIHFCEELSEFWAFKVLLGEFVQRLPHCCAANLNQLMELPAVKLKRAKQLYKAGYKTLLDVANTNVPTLRSSIKNLSSTAAYEIIASAQLQLIAKAEHLKEEADEILGELLPMGRGLDD